MGIYETCGRVKIVFSGFINYSDVSNLLCFGVWDNLIYFSFFQ